MSNRAESKASFAEGDAGSAEANAANASGWHASCEIRSTERVRLAAGKPLPSCGAYTTRPSGAAGNREKQVPHPIPDGFASVAEAIESRRSVRGFRDRPVELALIARLLTLAGRAPSGSNIQPWKLHVLTGPALARLTAALTAAHAAGEPEAREYEYYPTRWREPYLDRRRRLGWQLYELAGVARGDRDGSLQQRGRNYTFFGAPVGLVFTIDKDLEQGSWLDYGMFLQTLMIAARGAGLDTCPQAAIASYPAIVRREVGVPEDETIVCGMALGYADPDEPTNALRAERVPVASFATFHAE